MHGSDADLLEYAKRALNTLGTMRSLPACDAIARLEAKATQLLEVIRRVQWLGSDEGGFAEQCPIPECGGFPPSHGSTGAPHSDGCPIGAVLKES